MTDTERVVSAAELLGGVKAAEGASDFKPPTDVLLALRPLGHHTVTPTTGKPFDAIETYCVAIGEDGEYTDLGLRDVGWQFVMRELDEATAEVPWIVGTITKKSRAYFLNPPNTDDMKRAITSISALVADLQAQEKAEGIVSDAFGTAPAEHNPVTDEEPF